jgi:hypothetical protein
MDQDEMSGIATHDPDYIRPVTRKQCIGCGAIGDSVDSIDHKDYCPEVADEGKIHSRGQ